MDQSAVIWPFDMLATSTICKMGTYTMCMAITLMSMQSRSRRPTPTAAHLSIVAARMIKATSTALAAGMKQCRTAITPTT